MHDMTGGEHYSEAHAALHEAALSVGTDLADYWLARAQVHATLALADATFDLRGER